MFIFNIPKVSLILAALASIVVEASPVFLEGRDQNVACNLTAVSASFNSVALPQNVSILITDVENVADGQNYTQKDSGYQAWQTASFLPGLCAVVVNVTDTSVTPPSNYSFGMFLPNVWNSRILTVGSESFAGAINWPHMGEGVQYGMAVISTDNGHSSQPGDLRWGLNQPARLLDWGYRAVHGSVLIGKLLTKEYYGTGTTRIYSYWSGCSTGGRQGLKEIQVDSTSFDGALIGAPAWDTKFLNPHITKMASDNLKLGSQTVGLAQLDAVRTAMYALCDKEDGVVDHIISRPDLCNITRVLESATPPVTLSDSQKAYFNSLYNNYSIASTNGAQTLVQDGWLPGSEDSLITYLSQANMIDFDAEWVRDWVKNDTTWQTVQFDDSITLNSIQNDYGRATADNYPKIEDYKDLGGKIIMYHGLVDGLVPTLSSMRFYNNTQAALNSATQADMDSFFRYFQIPGMGHCFNIPQTGIDYDAPWHIGAYGQSVLMQNNFPGASTFNITGHANDPMYDALAALIQWTEPATARTPDQFIATNWNATNPATNQLVVDPPVYRTRPICKWPQVAKNITATNLDVASSWACRDR